jgi:hypothetical protein
MINPITARYDLSHQERENRGSLEGGCRGNVRVCRFPFRHRAVGAAGDEDGDADLVPLGAVGVGGQFRNRGDRRVTLGSGVSAVLSLFQVSHPGLLSS